MKLGVLYPAERRGSFGLVDDALRQHDALIREHEPMSSPPDLPEAESDDVPRRRPPRRQLHDLDDLLVVVQPDWPRPLSVSPEQRSSRQLPATPKLDQHARAQARLEPFVGGMRSDALSARTNAVAGQASSGYLTWGAAIGIRALSLARDAGWPEGESDVPMDWAVRCDCDRL